MNFPARGTARVAARLQWRLASSSARGPRPPGKPPAGKPTPAKPPPQAARPYKPSSRPASEPTQPPPPPETVLSLWRRSWLPLTGAAIVAGFLGFYIVGTVTASLKSCACPGAGGCEHATPTGRPPALTGDGAEQFDRELDSGEWWTGITGQRRRIAAQASGDVLELAIGTGRNLEYYNWDGFGTDAEAKPESRKGADKNGITSFTGLDVSADMLDVARRKLSRALPEAPGAPVVKAATMPDHTGGQLSYLDGRLRLVHSDAHRALPLPPSPSPSPSPSAAAPGTAKYDTIVQTFGLCSVADPIAVLRNLAGAVRPGSGRIILLEHGRGRRWDYLNLLLDHSADQHFARYGCWWNRDIEALVKEAARGTPGLEVVTVERPTWVNMGTLLWVELRVADPGERDVGA